MLMKTKVLFLLAFVVFCCTSAMAQTLVKGTVVSANDSEQKQILIIKCFSYTMILYYKDNTTINNIKRKNKMFFLILLHTTKFVQIKI